MKLRKMLAVFLSAMMAAGSLSVRVSAEEAAADPAQLEAGMFIAEIDEHTEGGRITGDDGVHGAGEVLTFSAEADHAGSVTASFDALMKDENGTYTRPVEDLKHPDRNTITFTMPEADVIVSAAFTSDDERSLFIRDMENGTIAADRKLINLYESSEVTLTLQPENGYRYKEGSLKAWLDDGYTLIEKDSGFFEEVEPGSVYTIDMGSSHAEVYAEFEKADEDETYEIRIAEDITGGYVETDLSEAEEGWTVTLKTRPEENTYMTLKYLGVLTEEDGLPVETEDLGGGTFTFIMPAEDVVVEAAFEIPEYEIRTHINNSADPRCDVTVDESAPWQDLVHVMVTLREACRLDSLSVVGESGTEYPIEFVSHNEGSLEYFYQFTMPQEAVGVYAEFSYIPYQISVNEAAEGNVSFSINGEAPVSGSAMAVYGDEITVTYTYENSPDTPVKEVSGFTYTYTSSSGTQAKASLESLSANGSAYAGTFTMPASDVEIGVVYDSPYTITIDEASLEAYHGHILASAFKAAEGDEIVLYARSEYSYDVDAQWQVTYQKEDGTSAPVEVTKEYGYRGIFTMPAGNVTVKAVIRPLSWQYIERSWDEESKSVVSAEPQFADCSFLTPNTKVIFGWYSADHDIVNDNRIKVMGDAYLILADGVTLNLTKGIRLTKGSTLHIYGQANDSGRLVIDDVDKYNAAIGTNDQDDGENDIAGALYIHGGTLDVKGGSDGAGIGGGNEAGCGTVVIYGGSVRAEGGTDAAGIGSGDEAEDNSEEVITIYGGTVKAYGGEYGAGIGGGDDINGGTVYIYGGDVTAEGGNQGAGIGGGEDGHGGTVTIFNGHVEATGGYYAAGIGGSDGGNGSVFTMYDGYLHAIGGKKGPDAGGGAGIGGGLSGDGISCTIYGGEVIAEAGYHSAAAGIGGGDRWWLSNHFGDGGTIRILGGKVTATGTTDGNGEFGGSGIGSGTRAHGGNILIENAEVIATGGEDSPAIGGGSETTITITNSTVTANGGKNGAGIGGAVSNSPFNITINNSTVTAISGNPVHGSGGAGIGGGRKGHGGNITINGGYVIAKCGSYRGAGVGGGAHGYLKGDVRINGATLYATAGSSEGDGIGNGNSETGDDSEGNIYISNNATVYSQASLDGEVIQRGRAFRVKNTLSLYDEAMFYTGNGKECTTDAIPLKKANQRGELLNYRTAIIMPCTHPDHTYDITDTTHKIVCEYCKSVIEPENHVFDRWTHTCFECGHVHEGGLYQVSFIANRAEGKMEPVGVIPGETYVLPECAFTSYGRVFSYWSVNIGGSEKHLSPGDTITVNSDVILTANWEEIGNTFHFSDVLNPDRYYYAPVYWALENGITTGTSPLTFAPEEDVTRGQFVTFLYRAAGEPDADVSAVPFKDVKADKFYAKAVAWAVENRITTGVSADRFAPDDKVSRAQIVTFLYRYAGSPKGGASTPFTDVKAGAYYAKPVAWAYSTGVTTGTTGTTFSPNEICTRGQAVTFLYRVSN